MPRRGPTNIADRDAVWTEPTEEELTQTQRLEQVRYMARAGVPYGKIADKYTDGDIDEVMAIINPDLGQKLDKNGNPVDPPKMGKTKAVGTDDTKDDEPKDDDKT